MLVLSVDARTVPQCAALCSQTVRSVGESCEGRRKRTHEVDRAAENLLALVVVRDAVALREALRIETGSAAGRCERGL